MHSIINESNLVMSQKIAELLEKRLTNVHKDILRLTEKNENLLILNNDKALSKNSEDSLQEILEQESNQPHLENDNNAIAVLFAERREKFSISNAEA